MNWGYLKLLLFCGLVIQSVGCRLAVRGVQLSSESDISCSTSSLPFGAGDGSVADPYQICSRTHLENISTSSSSHFILKSNLNLGGAGNPFTPIPSFSGTLNGNNKTITGLFSTNGGMFANTSAGTYIHHLTIDGAIVTQASDNAGILINLASDTTLDYITVSNSSIDLTGFFNAGGMVGVMYHVTGLNLIAHSFGDNITVKANKNAGGILGFGVSGTITRTHSTGMVTSLISHSGGLVGGTHSTAGALPPGQTQLNFSLTYSSAMVVGPKKVGGILGEGDPIIEKSYSNGIVTGNGGCDTNNIFCESGIDVGGLVGALKGSVTTSFAFGTVTSNGKKAGGLLGSATTTATVSNSFATMNVYGAFFVGGIIGYNEAISVSDSYTLASYIDETMQVFSPASSSFADFGSDGGFTVTNVYYNWDGFYSYSTGPALGPITPLRASPIANLANFSQPSPIGPTFDYTTPVWRYTSSTPWGANSPVPQWVCVEGADVGLSVTCVP